MNTPNLRRVFIAIFTLFILSLPRLSAALDLIVEHNPTDPAHFSSIQAAIDYARNQLSGSPPGGTTFRVVVKADPLPYHEVFAPISNVPVIGSETAATFLDSYPYGTLISINNVSNVTIKNFTFTTAAIGIAVTNSSSITIANNIFRVGSAGTALQVQGSPATAIVNNTFYQNGTALSTNVDNLITNNIFIGNGTAIATVTNLSRVTYNAFHNNGNNGAITLDGHSLPNSSVTNPEPLFVNPDQNDFHLQSGSPCHMYGNGNAGNSVYPNAVNPVFADMGAYGGPDSDTIPFRVLGLTGNSGTNSIVLNWNPNLDYQVSGYHVYYGTTAGDRSGTGAAEGNSPLSIPRGVNSATLSNLPITPPTTPAAVTGVMLSPGDGSLFVGWNLAANATGYKVYYGTTPFTAAALPTGFQQFNGADTSGGVLYNLTNGVTYYVAVAAVAQSRYFLTVTAFNSSGGTPGVANESAFAAEKVGYLGPPRESAPSNVVIASPAPQPIIDGGLGSGLWGGGASACFIATAAYGCYSDPQVQVLRDFRDRFLLTNVPGRAFVGWYYRYGPVGAAFINAHPWCKPLVRVLLLPLLGGATVLLHSSLPAVCGVIIVLLLLGAVIVRRNLIAKGYNRFFARWNIL